MSNNVILIVKEEEMECYLLKKCKPVNLFLKEITKESASDRWEALSDDFEFIDVTKKGVRELFPNCFASAQKKYEIKIDEMDLDDIGEYTKKHHTQVVFWDPEYFDVSDSDSDSDEECEEEECDSDNELDLEGEKPTEDKKPKAKKTKTKAKK